MAPTAPNSPSIKRTVAVVGLALLLTGGYYLLARSGALDLLEETDALRRWIVSAGWWGPLLIVGLMVAAIVFSPIPSAPIALASGALFGHGWGTAYIVVGAELGALVAFFIARIAGYPLLRRWFGVGLDRVLPSTEGTGKSGQWLARMGSQNGLTMLVLGSRLLPFLSFDLVSYAAGLTPLTTLRFAVATFVGLIPMSFLLAHFGDELTAASSETLMTAALLFGAVTIVPVLVRWLWLRTHQHPIHQLGEYTRRAPNLGLRCTRLEAPGCVGKACFISHKAAPFRLARHSDPGPPKTEI